MAIMVIIIFRFFLLDWSMSTQSRHMTLDTVINNNVNLFLYMIENKEDKSFRYLTFG